MIRRRQFSRTAGTLLALVLAATGAVTSVGTTASAAARTVYYDASRAGEFRTNFDQAATIWNSSVTNVRLVARTPGNITIYVDTGWPRAQTTSLGNGRVWMGTQAVDQGYDRTRIATHEIGHILGLPDNRTGLCTDLMSGSSAPVSCRNAKPSAAEAARVNSLFAGGFAAPAVDARYVWTGGDVAVPAAVSGLPG
ncbi:snapalysin family zinc-dependent metalloprotease [Micromonospora rifamycinica]|uniref:snapalysin family zinc-dependent metalloprotease n=1 Tax=Micromonospora rifamycinica TaxID=291594 RepID=UPI00325346AC